jgi:hypothetical protein
MKKIIATAFTAIILIAACKKDENTTTGSLELTSTNLAGKYKTTAATFTPAGSTLAYDFFNTGTTYPACEKDNIHTFTASTTTANVGTYNYADSGVYCTPIPMGHTGTYTITPPNQLSFDGRTYLVESLTTTNLVVGFDSTAVVASTTISGRAKLTLTKQP